MRSTAECVNSYIMSDVDNDTDVSSGINFLGVGDNGVFLKERGSNERR